MKDFFRYNSIPVSNLEETKKRKQLQQNQKSDLYKSKTWMARNQA